MMQPLIIYYLWKLFCKRLRNVCSYIESKYPIALIASLAFIFWVIEISFNIGTFPTPISTTICWMYVIKFKPLNKINSI